MDLIDAPPTTAARAPASATTAGHEHRGRH
jgi:hypothetical protein